MKEENMKKKLMVSAILFKNNVPVGEAKLIGTYIEQLESNWKELKKWLEAYDDVSTCDAYKIILNKMQELESGTNE